MRLQMAYMTTRLREKIKMAWERHIGVPQDHFLALSNLARELAPLHLPRPIEDIWLDYRVQLIISDMYRNTPQLFPGFQRIGGIENVMEHLDEGGVIVTFHYAEYRHGVSHLVQKIRTASQYIPLRVIADTDSYQREPPIWRHFLEKNDCPFLIAEDPQVGMKLFRHLKRRGWVFLYVDGNTGAGVDSSPLQTRLLTSQITIRSGLFRLLARTEKPIIVILAEHTESGYQLTLFPAFRVSLDSLEQSLDTCYSFFRGPLMAHPELWRFWFRHHLQVQKWQDLPQQPDLPMPPVWTCRNSSPTLAVEVKSGYVYTLGSY